MARKAGQGKEESRARQQEEKTPVREEEEKPACHGGAHHVVEQGKAKIVQYTKVPGVDLIPSISMWFCAKIYTDWANHYLAKSGHKRLIKDLQQDITDGVLLAEIIQII
ncbi:hypothetical protein STEG23_013048, partial [Scotinomys teguina]